MPSILIVDDDVELCDVLIEYLRSENFEVDSEHDGESGVLRALSKSFDLIMLDIMMPKMNGLDCLREIRKKLKTPVLMLTAKGEEVDRIVGLELGADDYLPKPFNPRELVARIRSILRRSSSGELEPEHTNKVIKVGPITLNSLTREASYQDVLIDLTSTEYNLLGILIRNAGEVVSKKELSQQGLGRPLTSYDRSVDMHISKIRQKITNQNKTQGQSLIKTVRNMGYQLIASLDDM